MGTSRADRVRKLIAMKGRESRNFKGIREGPAEKGAFSQAETKRSHGDIWGNSIPGWRGAGAKKWRQGASVGPTCWTLASRVLGCSEVTPGGSVQSPRILTAGFTGSLVNSASDLLYKLR